MENSHILIGWVMTMSWEEGWVFSKLWSPRSNPQGWMPSGDLIHIAPQGIKWGFISLKMVVCFSLIKMCFPFILSTVLSLFVPYGRDARFGCPLSSSFMLFWTWYWNASLFFESNYLPHALTKTESITICQRPKGMSLQHMLYFWGLVTPLR